MYILKFLTFLSVYIYIYEYNYIHVYIHIFAHTYPRKKFYFIISFLKLVRMKTLEKLLNMHLSHPNIPSYHYLLHCITYMFDLNLLPVSKDALLPFYCHLVLRLAGTDFLFWRVCMRYTWWFCGQISWIFPLCCAQSLIFGDRNVRK